MCWETLDVAVLYRNRCHKHHEQTYLLGKWLLFLSLKQINLQPVIMLLDCQTVCSQLVKIFDLAVGKNKAASDNMSLYILGESKKSLNAFGGLWNKTYAPDIQNWNINQPKANLDEKIVWRITHPYDPTIKKNACKEFVWESRIPHSSLVHYLCGIEVYIVNIRNRIMISIASKSWTRMECGILLPKHAFYQHFPHFWV